MMEFFEDPLVKYYLAMAVMAYPFARIFRRAGFDGRNTAIGVALLLVPPFGWILSTCYLAIRRWPVKAGAQ